MDARRLITVLWIPLVLAPGQAAWALVPGGALPRADCLAQWRVTTRSAEPSRGMSTLDCQDGDPSCDADGRPDGQCTFNVSICILESDPRRPDCVAPGTVTGFRRLSPGLEPPAVRSARGCGRASPFRVAVRRSKGGAGRPSRRLRLRMTAIGRGFRDVDRLALRCMPSPITRSPTTDCPPNPTGPNEPNEVVLTSAGPPSDLDLGWTGIAHNLDAAANNSLHICLEGCDASREHLCDTRIVTGSGTVNGALFGPPLPLAAGGLPICLLPEYDAPVFTGGTADLSTGALQAAIGLRVKVFITDPENVCPRCRQERCDGGANDGGACSVDASLHAVGGEPPYDVSRDCPPLDEARVGTIPLRMTLTSGSSVLEALPGGDPNTPCVAQAGEPAGVPPEPDRCSNGCDAECAGDACAMQDMTGPGVCLSARGGVSQQCCADDPNTPCFPRPVERAGSANRPAPRWPNPFYPKQNRLVAVATFCAAATGAQTIDSLIGLPGPGAIILPAGAQWMTPQPSDGGGDGGVPAPY